MERADASQRRQRSGSTDWLSEVVTPERMLPVKALASRLAHCFSVTSADPVLHRLAPPENVSVGLGESIPG